ncbi:MAG TPA: M20 family metallopeptidase [Phycisphaerae bacterium]|nr:M20 family metallopeptidase [Phycisphaerae bacterium]HNU46386.1 M20 family metallopeptidase [Phycisphaerae bacterium]
MPDFDTILKPFLPELTTLRHELHMHPEPGYKEQWTARRILSELERIGRLHIRTGVAETGIVATLNADRDGPCVALRADLDALPMTEANTFEYRSQNAGCMHACGHDGHMTCLVGAARVLAACANELPGKVKFIFQPAEEGGSGGKRMVEEGALDDPPVDAIFAMHGWPATEFGHVVVGSGPIFAATAFLEIDLAGKGTHAAYPHVGDDLILVSAHLVTALQAVAARFTDPLDPVIVSITAVHTGHTHNVLPDTAKLLGTIRALSSEVLAQVQEHVRRTVDGVAGTFGVRATVRFLSYYPVLANDPQAAALVAAVAGERLGTEHVVTDPPPTLGGEDFAFFLQRVPGAMWRLGLRPPGQAECPQLHHPKFDFPDAAIPLAVDLHCRIVSRYLRQGW